MVHEATEFRCVDPIKSDDFFGGEKSVHEETDNTANSMFSEQIKSVIDQVHAQCEKLGPKAGALLQGFLEPLAELERYEENTRISVHSCN